MQECIRKHSNDKYTDLMSTEAAHNDGGTLFLNVEQNYKHDKIAFDKNEIHILKHPSHKHSALTGLHVLYLMFCNFQSNTQHYFNILQKKLCEMQKKI